MGFRSGTKPYFKAKSSLLLITHFTLWGVTKKKKEEEKVKSPSFIEMALNCKSCPFSAILAPHYDRWYKSFPFTIRKKCDIHHRELLSYSHTLPGPAVRTPGIGRALRTV